MSIDSLWTGWLILTTAFCAVVVTPGPDFFLAVRHAVLYSRRAGIFTAFGFGLGVAVHVTYAMVGLAAIIAKSVVLFTILKYAGAAYLIYIGIKSIKSRGIAIPNAEDGEKPVALLSDRKAFIAGLTTNLLNPKATLFFLALFTQVLDPTTMTLGTQFFYGATLVIITIAWFSVVATILTRPALKQKFISYGLWIDRVCGAMFIALGIRLALTKGSLVLR